MNCMNLQSLMYDDENIQTASIQYEKYIVDPKKKKKKREKFNSTRFYDV